MRTHCKMIPEITKIQLQSLLSVIAKEIALRRRGLRDTVPFHATKLPLAYWTIFPHGMAAPRLFTNLLNR